MRHHSRVVKTWVVKFRNAEFKNFLWRQPACKEATSRRQALLLRILCMGMFVSFVPLDLKGFSREESVNYVCVGCLPFHLIVQQGCCYSGKVVILLRLTTLYRIFLYVFFYNRNAVPFTATQVEAIRAGMQPGLTMVRFIFLNSLLDAKATIEVYLATLLSFHDSQISQSGRKTNWCIGRLARENAIGFSPSLRIGWECGMRTFSKAASIAMCSCYYMEPIHSRSPPSCRLSA